MPETNWIDEATRFAGDLVRMNPPPPSRGVMKSDYPGVSVVVARSSEFQGIKQRLDDAGIEILGQGNSLGPAPDYTVAAFVHAEDLQMLSAIVGADSKP